MHTYTHTHYVWPFIDVSSHTVKQLRVFPPNRSSMIVSEKAGKKYQENVLSFKKTFSGPKIELKCVFKVRP